ncbi:hypothetical protein HMN09_01234000 [Mycena chlorophos]|uniref:Uncharacterized protein n=1 Tax=Mycena chlorophos TaxID=658473 RepID=A0A8H6VXG1_MYCCL|nr:hypothetical protein HMN09_01234000 [Mycena chlorophos]
MHGLYGSSWVSTCGESFRTSGRASLLCPPVSGLCVHPHSLLFSGKSGYPSRVQRLDELRRSFGLALDARFEQRDVDLQLEAASSSSLLVRPLLASTRGSPHPRAILPRVHSLARVLWTWTPTLSRPQPPVAQLVLGFLCELDAVSNADFTNHVVRTTTTVCVSTSQTRSELMTWLEGRRELGSLAGLLNERTPTRMVAETSPYAMLVCGYSSFPSSIPRPPGAPSPRSSLSCNGVLEPPNPAPPTYSHLWAWRITPASSIEPG